MKQWNENFKKYGKIFTTIHKDLPQIVEVFKRKKVKKILDLGSGSGRHLVYLAKHGFEMFNNRWVELWV